MCRRLYPLGHPTCLLAQVWYLQIIMVLTDVLLVGKSTYEELSSRGRRSSSITPSSLVRLSMHCLSSGSFGPNMLPRPAALLSRNSANCSLSTPLALARAFQNSLRSTSSLSTSSLRALNQQPRRKPKKIRLVTKNQTQVPITSYFYLIIVQHLILGGNSVSYGYGLQRWTI